MKNSIGGTFLNKLRENVNSHLDEKFYNGYDTAAGICLEVITKRIDELYKKINEGKLLSDQEQFLMAQLNGLKREIEDRLRNVDNIEN